MRSLSIILLLVILISAITSCSNSIEDSGASLNNGSVTNPEDNPETEEADERYLIREDIPADSDFEGYSFRILTRDADHHLKEVQAETETGETINDAVYHRNRAIEERLNINIEIIVTPEATETELTTFFNTAVMANDDSFDLALPHMVHAGTSATQGIMYDWHSIPYIDFAKPWWNSVVVDELTVNNKLFLAMSDYCISSIDYTWVILYNYQMGADYNVPNLYDLIKSGDWTIDEFTKYMKSVSIDIDGNGVYDYNDIYGFTTHNNSAVLNWMFALDKKVTEMNSEGYPELILNDEKMVSIVNKMFNILHTDNNTLVIDTAVQNAFGVDLHDKAAAAKFERNETLFAAIRIYYIDLLRNMESEFGIIPFPKYDSSQPAYYTHVDGHAPLMSVPKTISNPERTGIIIEALSAETYREVVPEVMNIVLQSKYARDEASYEMLELILDGRVYTFGYIYDGWKGMQWSLVNMMNQKSTDFSSYYAKNETAALAQYDTIIESYYLIN